MTTATSPNTAPNTSNELAAARAADVEAYKAFIDARERVFDALRASGNPPEVLEAVFGMSRAATACVSAAHHAGLVAGRDIYGRGL
jgi:hypothetical protein